jgi:hypothetical protein
VTIAAGIIALGGIVCLCYVTVDRVVCLISARKLVVDNRYFDSVVDSIEERNIRVVLSIN